MSRSPIAAPARPSDAADRSGQGRMSGIAAARIGVLALALATMTTGARGQETLDASSPSWAEGSFMTGDWGGQRTRLADHGLAPYAIYTAEGFASAGKGIQDGWDWTSVLEFGLDVDAQKLVGIPGGSAEVSFLWIEGTNPSERVGNLNAISSYSAHAAARLYQLWYKQDLLPVKVKLGQLE